MNTTEKCDIPNCPCGGTFDIEYITADIRQKKYATDFAGECSCEDCNNARELMFWIFGMAESQVMHSPESFMEGGEYEAAATIVLEYEPRFSC